MQDADLGWMTQRLVNNAITFRQTQQRSDLFFSGISVQIDVQSNLFEPNRHIFGNAERTTKIDITLRSNCRAAQWNVQSGCDCTEGDSCASHQRFEQHISRARALSVA